MVVFRVWRQGRRPEWGDTLRSNVRRLLRRVQRPSCGADIIFTVVFCWTRTTLKGTRARRLYNYYYHNSRSRNQQPEWLLVSPRPPAAASPTWGAKKIETGLLSCLYFFCFNEMDEKGGRRKRPEWSFSRRGIHKRRRPTAVGCAKAQPSVARLLAPCCPTSGETRRFFTLFVVNRELS